MEPFNGLGVQLGNLARLSDAESRSISPENPTGEKGKGAMALPDLKTSLVVDADHAEFMFLNRVILQACSAEVSERFPSAAELLAALVEAEQRLSAAH